jgi:cyclopropane fatty-acyl-phospholipid synthase-like methyltransferase
MMAAMTEPFLPLSPEDLAERFPLSANYDISWVIQNAMGPNVLWLLEDLAGAMQFEPGMRILDLGCGRAISSIFLAQQFDDLRIWAADLWIKPAENLLRIRDAGVIDRVFPISVEAHTLPFAEGFFDAIISVDAFHYFGTDDLYLSYLAKFLRPGGQLGISVPSVRHELNGEPPEHLATAWDPDYFSFHSPEWLARHWGRTGIMESVESAWVADGARLWKAWNDISTPIRPAPEDVVLVDSDAGRLLGFTRMVARKKK